VIVRFSNRKSATFSGVKANQTLNVGREMK